MPELNDLNNCSERFSFPDLLQFPHEEMVRCCLIMFSIVQIVHCHCLCFFLQVKVCTALVLHCIALFV